AMQDADFERVLAKQGIGQRRLADADATKYGQMQLIALELAKHRLQALEVGCQRSAHGLRYLRIFKQGAQAFLGLTMMALARHRARFDCGCGTREAPAQALPPVAVCMHWPLGLYGFAPSSRCALTSTSL